MSNFCVDGGPFAWRSTCTTDRSRDFSGRIPAGLLAWEQDVIRRHFGGTTMGQWEQQGSYHLYRLENDLVSTQQARAQTAWYEYRMAPAPTLSNRSQPVMEGDRSQAHTVVTLGKNSRWIGPNLPLPGGPVRHYVNWNYRAIINATESGHMLHPGTIMRYLTEENGMWRSNTVGRGTGMVGGVNEQLGMEIFDDLDDLIRERLVSGR